MLNAAMAGLTSAIISKELVVAMAELKFGSIEK
jgi:hypothetical protein